MLDNGAFCKVTEFTLNSSLSVETTYLPET